MLSLGAVERQKSANGASVAEVVRRADLLLLLGADLETSPNPDSGWDAVLSYSKPDVKASAVKVPHHGSPTAHHDAFWTDLADQDAVAIVTPWTSGRNFLPTAEALRRLRSITGRPDS